MSSLGCTPGRTGGTVELRCEDLIIFLCLTFSRYLFGFLALLFYEADG